MLKEILKRLEETVDVVKMGLRGSNLSNLVPTHLMGQW
jgi:hypothetical protein